MVGAAKLAPNHFLGTCLDQTWVARVETELGISALAYDSKGRLVHPYLHATLKTPRFSIMDPHTAVPVTKLYRSGCMLSGSAIYGVGAAVDADGEVTDPGRVNWALVLELNGWASQQLTTMVFSIITQELVHVSTMMYSILSSFLNVANAPTCLADVVKFGYKISFFQTTDTASMAERMSSVGNGSCTSVHTNMEVWVDPATAKLYRKLSNESYSLGSIGYDGRSGVYTTMKFIQDGHDATKFSPALNADHWRDYKESENLLKGVPILDLKSNAKYYPPTESGCADNKLGCLDSCSKTEACTTREKQSKECMVVAMMYDYYDEGYLQAVFANNQVPAYFYFIGYDGVEAYAVEAEKSGKSVVFYHYEPDPLHFQYPGLFERISLPRSTSKRSSLSTGLFGEHGYGQQTDNLACVDFPFVSLEKYAASLLQDYQPVESLMSRMSLEKYDMHQLMNAYIGAKSANPLVDNSDFTAACSWMKDNYPVWSLWLSRLPLCDLYTHVTYGLVGCDSLTSIVFPRQAVYKWKVPNPKNILRPYNCDGGLPVLPPPITTNRTCEWLKNNVQIWIFWARAKPVCDSTFVKYNVSGCDRAGSKREARFYWLIEDPKNASLSAECKDGIQLYDPVLLDCEYVPYDPSGFTVLAIHLGIWIATSNRLLIKRSQYQFLLTLLQGGIFICGAVWLYAGEPTRLLCTFRSAGISLGFTLIFGSLVVKSLRVYRVFMSGNMKRVVLSTKTMFKILGVFVLIDTTILVVWDSVDPSLPTIIWESSNKHGGSPIERLRCTSSSFIFTALLIFWKAVLLFTGLYLSFLIRKVSSDFQELIWIFASALVVLFTSLILLPMAYLVELPATTFYLFFSFLLLASTATVMGLMIVPKTIRLHDRATDSTATSTTSGGGGGSQGSGDSANSGNSTSEKDNTKSIVLGFRPSSDSKKKKSKPSKVQVTPVQQFTSNDDS